MTPTSSSNIYTPVLRWKAAEVTALSNLSIEIKSRVTPLFELCPSMFYQRKKGKSGKSVTEIRPIDYLLKKLTDLNKATSGLPLYLDLVHVRNGVSPYPWNALWNSISHFGDSSSIRIIPATGFYGKGPQYQALVGSVVRKFQNGCCVRLSKNDLSRPSIDSDIVKLLDMLGVNPAEVDMVIDLKSIDVGSTPYEQLLGQVPIPDLWRSTTFLAGSFPKDLSRLKAHNTYIIPRLEWIKWFSEELIEDSILGRKYRFGDYTVQHPSFSEPPEFSNPSASIRYASEDYWLVLRGEGLRNEGGMGHAQYPAQAQLLVDKPEYSGAGFSHADKLIMEKSLDVSRPGNPEQWLMIAINHHITYTVRQLNPELRPTAAEEVLA